MTQPPQLTTQMNLASTYNPTSARCCRMSYKVTHSPLQFSRDAQTTYRRNGDSTARDNWILGKGSVADGWDGWSLVQGESRYWESKLQKPEYRGKCGGAAANRLSEETIIKTLSKSSSGHALMDLPPGKLVSEFLKEQRIAGNSKRADALHAELLTNNSSDKVSLAAMYHVPSPPSGRVPQKPQPPSSPRTPAAHTTRGGSGRRTVSASVQPVHNHAKDYWEAKNAAKQSEEQKKLQRFEMLMKQKAAKEQQRRKPMTRAILLASGNPIEGDSGARAAVAKATLSLPALPPPPSSPRAAAGGLRS